ncbi:Uncharacterized protein dnm_090390 [Desulfonema magnum]|uniref:Uncharacterized protein n=1 Tax=Desulfonema magnum TaxID=45655 RepID=A0A975BWB9_9BACT|nr:Uncharacterized protein dnm_090390 [Desulfonema magnum]
MKGVHFFTIKIHSEKSGFLSENIFMTRRRKTRLFHQCLLLSIDI